MSDERRSLKELFNSLLNLETPEERASELRRIRSTDSELSRKASALLEAFERSLDESAHVSQAKVGEGPGDAIDAACDKAADLTRDTLSHVVEEAGAFIGPYKLRQRIGEGGMGAVWMAEQQEPVRRTVAVKVIKAGMDSREVVARFDAERQALALMDHPNIARVLDAGTAPGGRPYFVMELVKGVPITEFCDKKHMPIDERLELFATVCKAVQHAHQKGIIHRDIKPSNILVTMQDGAPVVKVIDFGLAKATAQKLTEKTLFTAFGQMVGTPAYMSPEQAEMSGLDVDTRTDIYSLGVVLYELLTGSTPLDIHQLRKAGYAEVQRIICEEEPLRPSTRLSSLATDSAVLAQNRASEVRRLVQRLRGDLDVIVMKSLEKDRGRRYEAAGSFAADIRRYLKHEAIEARAPSTLYRIQKAVQRHKFAVLCSATVALALVAATLVSAQQAMRAKRAERMALAAQQAAAEERDRAVAANEAQQEARQQAELDRQRAEESRRQSAAVSDFLVRAFRSPDPQRDGYSITIAEVLKRSATELSTEFTDRPQTKAVLLDALGRSFTGLGLHEEALPVFKRLRSLQLTSKGPYHPDTLLAMQNLAVALLHANELEAGLTLSEETLALMKVHLGADHPGTLQMMNVLARTYQESRMNSEAIPLLEETLAKSKSERGADHRDTIVAMNNLAHAYREAGELQKARDLLHESYSLAKVTLGPDHPHTLTVMNNLALAHLAADEPTQAVQVLEQALELKKARLGEQHPVTIQAMSNLAMAYLVDGKGLQALPLLERFLADQRARVPVGDPEWIKLLEGVANNLMQFGQYAAAETYLRECLDSCEQNDGRPWMAFHFKSRIGEAMAGQARTLSLSRPDAASELFSKAETQMLSAHEGMELHEERMAPEEQVRLRDSMQRLVDFYETRAYDGDSDKALRWKTRLDMKKAESRSDAEDKQHRDER